jgi:single-stranded-DNA-specific exonuclease
MKWEISPQVCISNNFLNLVRKYTNLSDGNYLAQLLWQRNIQTEEQLQEFFSLSNEQVNKFDEKISSIQNLLENALLQRENIAICSNGEPDNLMASIILWDGLSNYFAPEQKLFYHLSNYEHEFHDLSQFTLDTLAKKNIKLLVICYPIINFKEVDYAQKLGINIISLADDYQYFSRSYFAYQIIKYLAAQWVEHGQIDPDRLLDMAAISLLYDLRELTPNNRYWAKIALKKLKKSSRIGVQELIKLCEQKGDRPTDISMGIGARLNRITRIYKNDNFYLDLFTTNDIKKCKKSIWELESINFQSEKLYKRILKEVKKRLTRLDLSTDKLIILADSQWELGILPLVAKTITQEYGLPTILLRITEINQTKIAQGYGYSIQGIDLNELVRSQSHLLLNYTPDQLTPKLSLLQNNINQLSNNLNQKIRQTNIIFTPKLEIDMIVTVADLAGELLKEIKYLEPYSLNNKPPKFLVKNCYLEPLKEQTSHTKIKFCLKDESTTKTFQGIWLCNRNDQLPEIQLDIIVEKDIDFQKKQVQIKLIAFREANDKIKYKISDNFLLDLRSINNQATASEIITIQETPIHWQQIKQQAKIAKKQSKKLALNYHCQQKLFPSEIWQQLLGIAKYLAQKKQNVDRDFLAQKLNINLITLQYGLITLAKLGLISEMRENELYFTKLELEIKDFEESLLEFIKKIEEEQFKKQYFTQVSLETISENLKESI